MSDFRRSWYRRKACAAYFCKVPDLREIRAWTCEIWPREQRPPGVFLVRLRAVFRSGFRLDPDKFLAIREFHVVHGMCLLSNVPGLADQLVASQEDSVRKRGNVGGKIPEFSAQPYFVGLFSRAWPCTEASLGSQDMILRTEAVGMFLMPRGVFDVASPRRNRPAWFGLSSFCVPTPEKIPVGKNGVMTHPSMAFSPSIPLRFWDDACQYPTCTDDIQHNPVLEMNEKLHRLAVGVLEIGAESVENFNVLEKLLIDLKDNFPRSCDKQPLSQRKNSVGATSDVVRTEVVRSPMVVKRKGRPRMKQLKSSMEEAVSKSKKKRNTTVARNLTQSTSTTGVGGSAYGDGSTSNMEYPMSMPHSNDGVIDLTNPMPFQSFVSESQAHGYEDQALNLT
uniref:Aminotransferase-like plant mobile domain-containing protein n=1 Tax=Fagus sylvatica TaxID=28930 RepID=A0A2N9FAQ3_FAGSY